ncbi:MULTISPECIES: hypothetical protein [Flavobacterium]|uniref:Uncharacterized protein n=1 Tax=Flavobacterium commune TaxID=1306519 RepID=A0A1D9PAR3_9FLAO|nr:MULTISPECIES: hypothetical protein [Flavobacterium]AOZ99663.1 hypothetical protein BIW12_09530 [Flavobacterium commune]
MQKLKLIEGEFTPFEFREVLSNLLLSKISFYEKKDFSSLIRYGKHDLQAIQKTEELKLVLKSFLETSLKAEKEKKKLMIWSEIQISLKNPESSNNNTNINQNRNEF